MKVAVLSYDETAESPREWDNLGIMACSHSRYNLGDEDYQFYDGDRYDAKAAIAEHFVHYHDDEMDFDVCAVNLLTDSYYYRDDYFSGLNDRGVKRVWQWIEKNVVMLPLYLYDHSGITMNTTGFTCSWDSGQVGIIYATRERISKEFGAKRLTKKLKEKVAKILIGEVEVYDQYLRGDVYCIDIYDSYEKWCGGNTADSCCGFYGDEWAEKAAKEEFGADAVVYSHEVTYESMAELFGVDEAA